MTNKVRSSKKEPILEEQGKKLRFLRKKYELKQENIAIYLKISQHAYSKLENDQMNITEDRLQQLANIYGISPEEIKDLKIQDKIIIKRIGDNHTGSHVSGVVIHQTNERTYTVEDKKNQELIEQLLQQNKQLLTHNQQLLDENQRLRGA